MEPGTAYVSIYAIDGSSTGSGGGGGGKGGSAAKEGAAYWLEVLRVLLVPLRTPALVVARGNMTRGCAARRRAVGACLAAAGQPRGAQGGLLFGPTSELCPLILLPHPAAPGPASGTLTSKRGCATQVRRRGAAAALSLFTCS
jgi:hypothetical protein